MLDLKEIARLRKAEVSVLTIDGESDLPNAMWNELLDAAEVVALIEEWQRMCDDPDIRWIWSFGLSWTRDTRIGYPTPKAAVLAALRPTGGSDDETH